MATSFEGTPKAVSSPKGAIIIDGNQVADTLQCCHCGMHWIVVEGSGKVRGWCRKCFRPTCGEMKCMECIPCDVGLQFMEGKMDQIARSGYFEKIKDKVIKYGSAL